MTLKLFLTSALGLFLLSFLFNMNIVSAQSQTSIENEKVGLKTSFEHSHLWEVDIDVDEKESTSCAVSPEGVEPAAVVCVKTQYYENDLALKLSSLNKAQLSVLIGSTCSSYQCSPEAKRDVLVEKTYGAYSGFEHAAELSHPNHIDANLEGSLFFVSRNKNGQLLTFSLHTAKGQAEQYRAIYESVIENSIY